MQPTHDVQGEFSLCLLINTVGLTTHWLLSFIWLVKGPDVYEASSCNIKTIEINCNSINVFPKIILNFL